MLFLSTESVARRCSDAGLPSRSLRMLKSPTWQLWSEGHESGVATGKVVGKTSIPQAILTWFVGSLHLRVRKTESGEPRQKKFSIRKSSPDCSAPIGPPPGPRPPPGSPPPPPGPPPRTPALFGARNRRLRLRSCTPPPLVCRLYQECSTSWVQPVRMS